MGEARSTVWKYSGRNTTAPKRAKPTISDSDPATAKTGSRISESGRIGSAARLSTNRNSGDQRHPERPHQHHLRRAPRPGRAAEARHEHDRAQPRREQPGAEVVDLRAPARALRRQRHPQHRQRGEPHRQVDVEDPPPRDGGHDHAPQQRPGDAGDAEHGPEQALVAAPFAGADDVADRGLGEHDQPARAEALDRAEGDQLGHVGRLPAQRRAQQEQHDRALQHALAPVQVAELAVDGRGRGLGQQEGARHPRQAVEPAEVPDDRRQRRRHDRLIERRQQHHQHQPAEDHPRAGLGDGLGRGGGRGGHQTWARTGLSFIA